MKTLPGAVCKLHRKDDADPAHSLELFADQEGIIRNTITKKVTIHGEKKIRSPLSKAQIEIGKITLDYNISEKLLLSRKVQYDEAGEGLIIEKNKRKFEVQFDPLKFRRSDVPGNI